jgi:TPR repeat protein
MHVSNNRRGAGGSTTGQGGSSSTENGVEAQFELGIASFESGDCAAAMSLWRCAAERGMARAQYNLGTLLHSSASEPARTEALSWWRSAAASGHSGAQQALATNLETSAIHVEKHC